LSLILHFYVCQYKHQQIQRTHTQHTCCKGDPRRRNNQTWVLHPKPFVLFRRNQQCRVPEERICQLDTLFDTSRSLKSQLKLVDYNDKRRQAIVVCGHLNLESGQISQNVLITRIYTQSIQITLPGLLEFIF
jgi:hypothetical protein